MAKGNLFQGMGRGKLGDVVFYRFNGQQASRVRNRHPKNPKSDGQLINRILVSNLAAAFSQLRPICNHSFEGKSTGLECMAEFGRINQRIIRDQIDAIGGGVRSFNILGRKGQNVTSMGHELQVSSGSLNNPLSYYVEPAAGGFESGVGGIYLSNNVQLAGGLTLTYGDVCTATGLQLGDQITILRFADEVGDFDSGSYRWAFNRLVLYPGGDWRKQYDDPAKVPFVTPTTADDDDAPVEMPFPNARNLLRNMGGTVGNGLSWDEQAGNGRLVLCFYHLLEGSHSPVIGGITEIAPAYAVIVSRKTTSGYLYSTSYIQYNGSLWDKLVESARGNLSYWSLSEALEVTKAGGDISIINEDYLDNADIGGAPIVPGGDENNG